MSDEQTLDAALAVTLQVARAGACRLAFEINTSVPVGQFSAPACYRAHILAGALLFELSEALLTAVRADFRDEVRVAWADEYSAEAERIVSATRREIGLPEVP